MTNVQQSPHICILIVINVLQLPLNLSIFLNIIPVLITVSVTVFFSVYLSLIIIRFCASVQLVFSNLFSFHNGGSAKDIA
jgi:hypothetical protein